MRHYTLALALLLAVNTPARADKNFEAFLAGVVGAVILNAVLNDEARRNTAPVVAVQAPPLKKTPRQQYLDSCQAYGYSEKYCVRIWDGEAK